MQKAAFPDIFVHSCILKVFLALEVVESPSLEIFKRCVDTSLGDMV